MSTQLKRSLGLPVVALYGLGNILGAGIYVLVGKVAGFAGTSTALAFMMAMVTAAFTAFAYMELAGRYPVSASASVYLHKAFGRRWLSVGVGMAMVLGGIASAATLAQGFAGYLTAYVPVSAIAASVALLVVLGLIALKGIGESAVIAALLTAVEVFGLLLVIWFGRSAFTGVDVGSFVQIDPAVGASGVIAGAFLAFYAFIGFEDMVNVAEEAKSPQRTMPLAILFALLASTLLYMLVVVVATSVVGPAELAASSAPLSLVLEKSGASTGLLLGVIGMVATTNGIIVQIIMGSRVLYGLANQGWLPPVLAVVHSKRRTPTVATVLVVGLMVLAAVLLPLVSLAQLTSFIVLTIFTLVNVSLIIVKRRHPQHDGYVTVPVIVPYVGVLLCLGAVAYQLHTWLVG